MDYTPQNLHMVIIIVLMLVPFNCIHIFTVDASLNAPEYFNLQEVYYMENIAGGKESHIGKVSGEDEREEKEGLILEKFRALLGLKSSNLRRPSNGDLEYASPSPAPSLSIESEAPAPTPVPPIHVHSHHYPPHHRPIRSPQIIHKEDRDKGGVRRILVAVFVSAGSALVLCVIGLFWICQRFKKQRKRSMSAVSVYSTGGGNRDKSKYVSSQNAVRKVSSDPGPDLFYIDSLGSALEPQQFCLKPNFETVNTLSNQNTSSSTLHEKEELDQEEIKSESDNDSCSTGGEIISIHETVESTKCEPDGCDFSTCDKMVPMEAHSSDDESFHSVCDSHSSNLWLSNASACGLSDTSEILSPNASNVSPSPLASPMNLPIQLLTPDSFSNPVSVSSTETYSLPPPPPPFPRVHILPSYSRTSIGVKSKASTYSTLPNSSSPGNSDSSSGSNQTPLNDLPPSPPKPAIGIPPPPCLPPFSKGNSTSLKGPPPPPSLLPQYIQLGKDGAPLPKLKPLHWDKVRAAPDRSMVWDKLRSSSFELDEEMIESLFGYNLQNSMKKDKEKSKTPSPSKHVLDPKRLQNITILSKAVNVSDDILCDALIQGKGLSLQQLEALVKMEPTKEEASKLSSYKGDINELGAAEKFVKTMLNVPFAFPRIEAMLYKETFEDEVVHLRKSFSMLEEACKELRSSRLFLKLLEAVLKTGNRMNVGTIRGGARAFKLDALLKLADVKGTDGKTTLLHFVVQEIVRSEGIRVSDSIMGMINQKNKSTNVEDREEDYKRMGLELVSGLSTELCNVKKTATIDLDVLATSVSNLTGGMTKLQHLVGKDLSMDEKSGNFVHSMRSFLNYAHKSLKELQEDEHRVLLHVRQITEYFHGDKGKDESNPLRIFVIVRDFLGMLDHVCKELRSLKMPSSPNPLAPFR
ncbi:unnamed protein product [Ilex paraguariensis]|uniref:Formin-like protein n=1 Tax=Ilex paraguariensis TaxID=185542 RepID=A0ABC8TDW4_9AQUA